MKWFTITSVNDIEAIIDRSRVVPCLILKHSTRCPISTMAKSRVEMNWDFDEDVVEAYYLDLIAHRDVSNYIAETFGVRHESPQALLIKDGECVDHASHLNIRVNEMVAA